MSHGVGLSSQWFFYFLFFQAGLSGSSAIVCAALSCLLDFYKIRKLIKVEVWPQLILNAEKELGVVAGLQDRVAQVYGGLVYMVYLLHILTRAHLYKMISKSLGFFWLGF